MATKVRQHVADAAKHPDTLTIRNAADWYTNALSVAATSTPEERAYINESWTALAVALGEQEQVAPVWISYSISELVQMEIRLAALTETEGGGENFST